MRRIIATDRMFFQVLLATLAVAVRTDNPYEVPVINDLANQRYNISLAIGTPPVSYNVLLDSGSTIAWVPIANASGCAPNCPWTSDPTSSSTIVKTNETYVARYGTRGEILVNGSYYKDHMSIGGLTPLKDAAFAIADFPKPFYDQGNRGILGMGCNFFEYGPDGVKPIPFPPLWTRLSKAASPGLTKFSMWLNSPNAASGTIQFGGEDSSKYRGKLLATPLNQNEGVGVTDWDINLLGIARGHLGNDGQRKQQMITPGNFSLSVILDSGAPNLYLPTSLYQPIIEGLGATEVINGAPWVKCSLRKPETGYLEFQIATRKAGQLIKIRVGYDSLIYPRGLPTTVPSVPDQDGERMCYFGVVPNDGPIRLLGAPFLRRAYTVFDLDNKELRMAEAKWRL